MDETPIDLRALTPDDICSITKGAALIGVTRKTIYNWLVTGKIDRYLTAGGATRVIKAQLLRRVPPGPLSGDLAGESTDREAAS